MDPGAELERRARWRWGALASAFGVICLGLLFALIHASTLRVAFTLELRGSASWRAGAPVAFRVIARPQGSEALGALEGEAWLVGGDGVARALGAPEAGGAVQTWNIALDPATPPGPYTLRVEVTGPGEAGAEIAAPVQIEGPAAPARGGLAWRHPCESSATNERDGTLRRPALCDAGAELPWAYPESGLLVANLSNRVVIFAPPGEAAGAEGGPIKGNERAEGAGTPAPLTAPTGGRLGQTEFTPAYPRRWLALGRAGAERRWIREEAGGMRLRPAASWVEAGGKLSFEVDRLGPRRPLFIDLWHEGRWVLGAAAPPSERETLRASLPLPPCLEGFVTLRAYDQPGGAHGAADDRVLWVGGAPPPLAEVAALIGALPQVSAFPERPPPRPGPLEGWLAEGAPLPEAERDLALEALLSRLEPSGPPAPLLVDMREAQLAAVERQRARRQRRLYGALAALVSFAALGLAGLFLRRWREERRRWQAIAEELEEWAPPDGEGPLEDQPELPAGDGPLWIAVALLLLAAGVLAAASLLTRLRWVFPT